MDFPLPKDQECMQEPSLDISVTTMKHAECTGNCADRGTGGPFA